MLNQIAFAQVTWFMILAQGLGFFGMLGNFISYQQNTNKRIVGVQIFAALFFFVHMLMIGATTGAMLNIVGAMRNFVFFMRPKKWAESVWWVYIFCFLYLAAGVLTWEGAISLLPTVAMIFGTIALFIIRPKTTRRLVLLCSVGWIIYGVLVFSVAAMISETLTIASILIAMYKFDRKGAEKVEKL